MKPTADEDQILTGEEAAQHMADTWHDIGMGKVNVEVTGPWLIVRRHGGDYSTFISLVDDTCVTVLDTEATTRHVPKEMRPDTELTDKAEMMLGLAFNSTNTGMYPQDGGDVFQIGFKNDDGYQHLNVSTTSHRIWVDSGDDDSDE